MRQWTVTQQQSMLQQAAVVLQEVVTLAPQASILKSVRVKGCSGSSGKQLNLLQRYSRRHVEDVTACSLPNR